MAQGNAQLIRKVYRSSAVKEVKQFEKEKYKENTMSLSKYSNSFRSNKLFYKKLLFNILQKRQNKEQGFTLIELLVSMVILTIVVGMTGTGLI